MAAWHRNKEENAKAAKNKAKSWRRRRGISIAATSAK